MTKKSLKNHNRRSNNKNKKLTKQERRAKYTKLARERRDSQLTRQYSKRLICYSCRQLGHVSRDCPENTAETKQQQSCCYKCGSTEHLVHTCPQLLFDDQQHASTSSQRVVSSFYDQELPFAVCYICKESGHLASTCPQNDGHGIYVKGSGGCRTCGSTQHKAKDCPKQQQQQVAEEDKAVPNENYDDLLLESVATKVVSGSRMNTNATTTCQGGESSGKSRSVKKKRRVVIF
jgi:zinc finger CCHC domain-containing protein 9